MIKAIVVFGVAIAGAFLGQIAFGDSPAINWTIGGFTGILVNVLANEV